MGMSNAGYFGKIVPPLADAAEPAGDMDGPGSAPDAEDYAEACGADPAAVTAACEQAPAAAIAYNEQLGRQVHL